MSKYTNEFKLKVVKYCTEQHHSYVEASNNFNIPSAENVRQWCKKYELHGPAGLLKNEKTSYSGEFKQSVVEYMHTNHLSASETRSADKRKRILLGPTQSFTPVYGKRQSISNGCIRHPLYY